MADVSDLLENSLSDLTEDKMKKFRRHLIKSYGIPTSELEKADITDTVDTMVARFTEEKAVNITLDILKKMQQNQLAKKLEKKHKESKAKIFTSC